MLIAALMLLVRSGSAAAPWSQTQLRYQPEALGSAKSLDGRKVSGLRRPPRQHGRFQAAAPPGNARFLAIAEGWLARRD